MLAPMAGVTDSAFRQLCRLHGAALVYTEMLSAEGIARRHGKTWSMARFEQAERPIAIQLFGTRPQAFGQAIALLEELGPDCYDLNFGCPAPKIVRSGGGSALLREPKLVADIAREAARAAGRPVLAKIRSGWEIGAENAVEVARVLEGSGIAAITVHGRTRSQMFSGRADWSVIAEVRRAVGIPVIGNGDIWSGSDAARMLNQTGCDLAMVGRGAMGNPWIFREIDSALEAAVYGREAGTDAPSWEERAEVIREHLRLVVERKGEARGVREMRKHLGWYIKGRPGAAALRQELMRAETEQQVLALLQGAFEP